MNCLRGGGGATWSWHPISHLLSIDEKRGEKGEWKGRVLLQLPSKGLCWLHCMREKNCVGGEEKRERK